MKAAELRDLADEELRGKLRELQEELFNLRFQLATGQIENVGRIRTVRRDIARMYTVLRQRQLASQESR
jgi:large subunit ribosomal protein L29